MENIDKQMVEQPDCDGYKLHLGENIRRIRTILSIKQDRLAEKMGVSQQTVSVWERKDCIDDDTLRKIALALEVPVTLIKNFDIDGVVYNIQNNYNAEKAGFDFDIENSSDTDNSVTNSLDVFRYSIESQAALYERLIKEKDLEIKRLRDELKKHSQQINAVSKK